MNQEKKVGIMKTFVFWFGIYDLIGGLIFMFFPGLWEASVGVAFPKPEVWTQFVGIMMIYWGLVSVWSSWNLPARATIMYWQGLVRIASPIMFGYWALFGGMEALVIIGIIDLVFGLGFIFGLPRVLGTTHAKLFRDAV